MCSNADLHRHALILFLFIINNIIITTNRNNCVFLYHDRDYLAYFGFDPVPTEVKGNPSVDVKWEQNQSQGLQKQKTPKQKPHPVPIEGRRKHPLLSTGAGLGPKEQA